ncbi:MAG: hypothetical protein JWL76_555 [Thermoleophilia bacterium]|nr:hypothetical protein [Thermoleophilia bacterium]
MSLVPDDLPIETFEDAAAFERWLRAHHDTAAGVWIQMAKKSSGIASIDWAAAVPVALCWGWIDGQRRSMDETWFLQRFTPRRPRSVWSKINVEHVERLIAEGRMQPAGLAQVEAAKADGRWDAAYSISGNEVPPELQAALDANPAAAAAFAELNKANRFAMCFRVQSAKRADTKARRVAQFLDLLERGERLV